jgi:hypothetical protein
MAVAFLRSERAQEDEHECEADKCNYFANKKKEWSLKRVSEGMSQEPEDADYFANESDTYGRVDEEKSLPIAHCYPCCS